MKRETRSLFYVNISVLLFGLAGLFAKWIALPAVWITFGRVVFSSLALFTFSLAVKRSLRIGNKRHLLLLPAAGVVLAFHWCSFLQSVQLSTVAIGTITFSTFPLFVTLLEPMMAGKKLLPKDLLAALLILVGVCVTIPELSLKSQMVRGILVGLASALSYAVLTLLNKKLSAHYPGTTVTFYEQGTAAVVLLPVVILSGVLPAVRDVGLLLVLGVFTTALAHALFIESLKGLPARLAGICSSLETVYGILLAFLLLGEKPGLREILGGAVILTVVICSQLQEKNKL